MLIFLAYLLTAAGAVSFYIAAANQSLLAQRVSGAGRRFGVPAFAVAAGLWVWQLGVGAGLFAGLVAAMLTWIALPALALLPLRKNQPEAR